MKLALTEEQELLRHTFANVFATESSSERVRAAEPTGFDPALWKQLAETGALGVRVPEVAGGSGASLLDAAVLAEEAGRWLVTGPFIEAIVAGRALAACEGDAAKRTLTELLDGTAVISLALRDLQTEPVQLVAGGSRAAAIVGMDGDDLVLLERDGECGGAPPSNLGSSALAEWDATSSNRQVLASGEPARRIFSAAIEEWKILTAAALAGLGRESLEIAGRYATERIQFDRPIGAFQGIAHPLADSVADVEGARLLVWKAIWAVANQRPEAAALVSMSFVWSSEATTRAVARALHTHGGYGLSLEYDIQLYHRRGKSWPLLFGDPQAELLAVADRLWGNAAADIVLPDAGDMALDFALGAEAEAFAATARRFFEENLDDELRAHAHFAWEGHHPSFQRALAEAGLLFPSWPSEYGGQGRDPYDISALAEVFDEFGWTLFAIQTTDMVAQTLMAFGSDELKREVLPRIASGDAVCSLGYTEPESGSDVAAAKTRAVRDGDEWIIDGQKMFTSGANLCQYVFLLTRTDPNVRKHKGLTMFLVPLDTPGIEIQAVHTLSDERTNLTYYSGVRISDRYRVGEVGAGWSVVAHALELEHGAGAPHEFRRMLAGAVEWARSSRRGSGCALDLPTVRERLARVAIHIEVSSAISARSLYASVEGPPDPAIGPMAKYYSTDRFIEDSADMVDLCAPDSLIRGSKNGSATGASAAEFAYRLSTAMAIYGGTSEIMKSIVAQVSLGMPRSRS